MTAVPASCTSAQRRSFKVCRVLRCSKGFFSIFFPGPGGQDKSIPAGIRANGEGDLIFGGSLNEVGQLSTPFRAKITL